MLGSNHTISTKRLAATDGKETYGDTYILEDVEAWIEQLNPEAAAIWSGENSILINLMHLEGLPDIKTSDLVIDDENTEYIVKAVQPFNGGDIASHSEIILTKRSVKI